VVIRVPNTSLPQDPQRPSAASGPAIVPVQAIGNPAAAAVPVARQASAMAAEILQEERDREVQTRVLELDVEARTGIGAIVNDYQSRRGKDAVERRGEFMAAISENSKRLRAGIKDRAVADVWARQDAALMASATNQLDAHYRDQNVRWRAETLQARASLLQQSVGRVAFSGGYDPATGRLSDEAERTRSASHDTIAELGTVMGWAPEQIELEQREADTQAIGQVAKSLIQANRFDEAEKVLGRHGDRMFVGLRDSLAEDARNGRAVAQRLSRAADEEEQAGALELQFVTESRTHTAGVLVDGVDVSVTTWDNEQRIARGGKPAAAQPVPLMALAARRLDEMREAGTITHELAAKTMHRIEQRVSREGRMGEAASKAALEQAQQAAQLGGVSRVEALPGPVLEQLRAAGEVQAMELWLRQGKQWITTSAGENFVASITDDQLRRYDTPEKLEDQLRRDLSTGEMGKLLARHREAVGKGTAEDKVTIENALILRNVAREAGILPADGSDASEEQLVTKDRYEEAALRLAATKMADGKMKRGDAVRAAATEVAADMLQTSSGPVPFLAATKAQQTEGYVDVPTGRRVFNRNVSEDEKAQVLEGIRAFNAEATKRNATLPPDQRIKLKSESLGEILHQWELQNVSRRTTDAANLQQIQRQTFEDKDVFREHHKLLRWNFGDPARALASLQQMLGSQRQKAEFVRWSGLNDEQLGRMVRLLEAEASK
jgi:hypothetical protein